MGEDHAAKPVVLVYAEPLLARSMTFVRSQGESLRTFVPYYVGPRYLADGLGLPERRVIVMWRGKSRFSPIAELPFKALGVAPFFVRRLRRLKPVLLHAHFGPMGLRALPLARALDIPMVVTFHGYDATAPDDLASRSRYFSHRRYVMHRKELEKGSSLLLAASQFVRDQLIGQGFSPNKVKVHYIGVDTSLFCPDSNMVRDPTVLFVGRLEEVKGCEYLIRAMAQVQTAIPAARLLIVGDGPQRRSLERTADDGRVRATFVGFQPPSEVKRWMNRASVLAAPSVRTCSGSEEGCGLALLEAQAMGLPVVSFVSGGIPEIVCHGETGFLSSERDHQSLSRYILMLLRDKNLADRLARTARARVTRLFDLETQTRALEAIYQDIIWARTCCPSVQDPAKQGSAQEDGRRLRLSPTARDCDSSAVS